ncbi:SRPBCC family protein [Flavicella sp.]|uniref:SRPBCC family protein n=1 Tax=Flavicella sp. TaxID=2957742 RepID=UPI00263045CF|nr:SRPBCC family protein [Flavicella sp.]MDG1804422.1 SRPBCC family protein [Flavicella sp.]MDG2281215.1 SRPBCC family protein [Flavicella sp.]
MTEVVVSKRIQVPANKVWSTLSSFRNIEAISPIERSETVGEGAGAKRTCYMPDGAMIHEVLEKVNNNSMEMQYKITEGPFPITGYVSNVKVEALENSGSKVTWGSQFETNEETKAAMIELFEGFYHVIIDSLESMILSQN